jgi:thiamine biosynthesis lipoprotein
MSEKARRRRGSFHLVITAILPALTLAVAIGPADAGEGKRLSRTLYSMGTILEITAGAQDESEAAAFDPAVDRAFASVAHLDTLLSTYKPYSEISAINGRAGAGRTKVHPLVLAVLDSSISYWRLTGGAFDPTVGPLLDLWGLKGGPPRVPTEGELGATVPLVDAGALKVDVGAGEVWLEREGQKIDLGGIAKGFALDRASRALRDAGIKNALLNFGGNLLFLGEAEKGEPWRAGIAHPRSSGDVVAGFPARDVAVSTSGDYENFFLFEGERYSHILDPRAGTPAAELCSATVIAPAGTGSDALSTAVVVLGPEVGMKLVESLPGVEAVIILSRDVDSPGPLPLYVSSGLVEVVKPAAGARLLTIPPTGR